MRSLDGALANMFGDLIRPHTHHHPKGKPCEHTARRQLSASQNRDFTRHQVSQALIWDFKSPEPWENKPLLFKHLKLWCFVRDAWADKFIGFRNYIPIPTIFTLCLNLGEMLNFFEFSFQHWDANNKVCFTMFFWESTKIVPRTWWMHNSY